jgi:ATF/CREB family transcription factor
MMSSSASGATITPNTLNAITGVLTAGNAANGTNASQPHPLSVSHLPPSGYDQRPSNYTNGPSTQNSDTRFSASAANAASSAANGLFLLSQAHQELTKREKAQRASHSDGDDDDEPSLNGSVKRGTKRKSYDVSASPPPFNSKPAPPKRSRALSNGKPKRGESISFEEDEEEEDEEDAATSPSDLPTPQMNGKKGGQKRPETEEEKRKNFLERNRQAALKCRQRKKAWLAQLQAKNEYLTQENQRLQEALVGAREEIARLSTAPMLPVGVAPNPPPNAHPVSVNVSLPTTNPKAVVSSRGYGY